MQYYTWSEIKSKLQSDLDLEDEDFITEDELLGYVNQAIDTAEALIISLNQNYFRTKAYLALTDGVSEYSLPSDIYGNKILRIIYDDGSDIYEIKPIINYSEIPYIDDSDDYRYILNNDGTNGLRLVLYPASRETSSTNVTIWYIRNAKRLSTSSDECDIPEFINFIYADVKVRVYEKEHNKMLPSALAEREKQEKLMIESLVERSPDVNDEGVADYSSYVDQELEDTL